MLCLLQEIVDRGGCPPEAWARTLSRLLPPGGTPSEEELGSEADETAEKLMVLQDGLEEEWGNEGADDEEEDYL